MPQNVTAIPSCATDVYAFTPCWDFFYTPNDSAIVNVSCARLMWQHSVAPLRRKPDFSPARPYGRFIHMKHKATHIQQFPPEKGARRPLQLKAV